MQVICYEVCTCPVLVMFGYYFIFNFAFIVFFGIFGDIFFIFFSFFAKKFVIFCHFFWLLLSGQPGLCYCYGKRIIW